MCTRSTPRSRKRAPAALNVLGKTSSYGQGDGIHDSFFAGHRDGCVGIKSRDTTIECVTAMDCHRNLRLWQNAEGDGPRCIDCASYDLRQAHVFTMNETPARLTDLAAHSSTEARVVHIERDNSASRGSTASPASCCAPIASTAPSTSRAI